MSEYFKSGVWNVICEVCGKKYKSDEVLKRWDGAIVCKEDFEHRHPQEFIRPRKERSIPSFTRPAPADTFLGPICYWDQKLGVAGDGVAGCLIPAGPISVCTKTGVSSISGYATASCSTPSTLYIG